MSPAQNVGNSVGAGNNVQPITNAPCGAPGETNVQQNSNSSTCIDKKQGTLSMNKAPDSPRSSIKQLSGSQTKLIKSADQQRTEETIIKLTNNPIKDVPHPEAVTATNNIIINVLTKIERTDFSADAIEMAIENAGAKNYAKENDPSTAEANAHKNGCLVLEKYDEHFHGGAYGKQADQDLRTKYKRDPNQWGCLPGALRGNIPTQTKENASKLENIGLPNESPEEYKQNNWSEEINQKTKTLENTPKENENYTTLNREIIELKKTYLKTKINFPENDETIIEQYSNQLIREYDTFSGDITIKKLEPGTVLVREFGQGQSVKGSCWCLATDLNSAVNCDKDLQTQLGVLPSWNGGGNRAVFVVPQEPPPIFVAVGTIAQQRNDKDYEGTVYHPGGGTQYNILTPNDCNVNEVENASGGFANAGKAFDKCCFVITNTGIIEAGDRKTVQANQAQVQQPNPVAINGSKLQQGD